MGKVTIQEISSKLIAQNGLSKKEATLFVNMMFDLIREALERDKMVKVKGLGTFKIIDVESRESVNVNTGERVLIEGHNKITFTPDALMKELVNKPFSQFETVVLNDGVDFKEANEEETADVDESENDMAEMPLVEFVAPDPIDLGVTVEPEKPIAPVVAETPVILEAPVIPETPVIPEAPVIPETPEIQDIPEVQTEPVIDNPVSPEEPDEESSVGDSSVEDEVVEEEDEVDEEEIPTGGMRWLIVLLASLIFLLVGYMLGNYFPWSHQSESSAVNAPQTEKVKEAAPVKKADTKPVAEPTKQPEEKVEAPAEEAAPSVEEADKPVAASVEQPKPEAKPEAQKPVEAPKPPVAKPAEAPKQQPVATAPAKVKLDKYELKDARVRNGAYRIIGLDHKEKVKEGDNLQRIAKRTLGPGMECYIEVYNGLTATSPLKKGEEINIPKLEWKVKRKSPKK